MILTIRTDKPEAEIGLLDADGNQLAYETWHAHRQLAETIHKRVQQILSVKGLTLSNVTGVVVYEGPGSFTGLRIGVSVANAMAYGLDIPVTVATGDKWIDLGLALLTRRKGIAYVTPKYGAPARVTQQKK